MTQKDYVKFAKMFASEAQWNTTMEATEQWINTIKSTADIFAADNPKFDRERFYAACESKEKEEKK